MARHEFLPHFWLHEYRFYKKSLAFADVEATSLVFSQAIVTITRQENWIFWKYCSHMFFLMILWKSLHFAYQFWCQQNFNVPWSFNTHQLYHSWLTDNWYWCVLVFANLFGTTLIEKMEFEANLVSCWVFFISYFCFKIQKWGPELRRIFYRPQIFHLPHMQAP